MRKIALLITFILVFINLNATTYYWLSNTGAAPLNGSSQNINDVINISGTNYYRHITTTAGSTVGLVPFATAIVTSDDIIFDDATMFLPNAGVAGTRTVNININTITSIHTLDASNFNGTPGITKYAFTLNITANFAINNGNIKLPNNSYFTGTNITGIGQILINPSAGGICNLWFGEKTTLSSPATLGIWLRGDGGTINFKDNFYLKKTGTATAGFILVQSNNPIDATNSIVNFEQNVYFLNATATSQYGGINIDRGRVFFHKNITADRGYLTAGATSRQAIINVGTSVVANQGVTRVKFNSGLNYPINNLTNIQLVHNKGTMDIKNCRGDRMGLVINVASDSTILSTTDSLKSNANTKFLYYYSNDGSGQQLGNNANNSIMNYGYAAALFGKHYLYAEIEQSDKMNQSCLDKTTFYDSLGVYCNSWLRMQNTTIAKNAVMVLGAGFTHNLSNRQPIAASTASLNVIGSLIAGSASGACSVTGSPTKLRNALINFNYATGPHSCTMYATQLTDVRALPATPSTSVNIDASNTDMGGCNGWAIGGIPFGTAPYNSLPYTGTVKRDLIWNNVLSGATFWTEKKWALMSTPTVFNECPPTFIDSVTVIGGSTLTIDINAAQCKGLYFQGAASTLKANRTTPADSSITLEIYGGLKIDNQLNNQFYRNIYFKAWQTYPQIKTSSSYFHAGVVFTSLNSSQSNTTEINNGKWTLQDDLSAYSSAETFTLASALPTYTASGPGCLIMGTRKSYPQIDNLEGYFPSNWGTSTYRSNKNLILNAGTLVTNGYNIKSYSFVMSPLNDYPIQQSKQSTRTLDMRWKPNGVGLPNRKTIFDLYVANGETFIGGAAAVGSSLQLDITWIVNAGNSKVNKILPDSSHIRFHANGASCAANFTKTSPKINYWDISFLNAKPTASVGYDGIYVGGNTAANKIIFYGANPNNGMLNLQTDTIKVLRIMDSRANSNTIFETGSSSATVDSLIFKSASTKIYAASTGTINVRKYLYFAPQSNNDLNNTTFRTYSNASITRRDTLAHTTYTFSPYGAKLEFVNPNCFNLGVISNGTIINSGDGVTFPTPHHYQLPAPRDTFYVVNASINNNTLTATQTVDVSNILNSSVNWVAGGAVATRTLYFRGNASAHGGNWTDNNVWAKKISMDPAPLLLGPLGECAPTCQDVVVFDANSFLSPTDSCYLTSATIANAGTFIWENNCNGVFAGNRFNTLNICGSWYCKKGNPLSTLTYSSSAVTATSGMTNLFRGRTIFKSGLANEQIQSTNMRFAGPVEFISVNPSAGAWSLLDSLSTVTSTVSTLNVAYNTTGITWNYPGSIANNFASIGVYVSAGKLRTRNQNIHTQLLWSGGTQQRALYLGSSRVFLLSGNANNGSGGLCLTGVLTPTNTFVFKADSATISLNGGTGTNSSLLGAVPYGQGFSTYFLNTLGTAYQGGFHFKTVIFNRALTGFGYEFNMALRNDTIDNLIISKQLDVSYAYKKARIGTLIFNPSNIDYTSGGAVGLTFGIGYNSGTYSVSANNPNTFTGLIIDNFIVNNPKTSASLPATFKFLWDTVYIKNTYNLNLPGYTLNHGKGGVTWFGDRCNTVINGSTAGQLQFKAITNYTNYPTYNIPGSAAYATNEHYYRKDSGVVCVDYTDVDNIWATGNGNTFSTPSKGKWITPYTPTTSVQYSLIDTVFASSYFDGTPVPMIPGYSASITTNPNSYLLNNSNSGRAKFSLGSNASLLSNAKGWDDSPYAAFPSTNLTLSQYTVCPGTIVTASLSLTSSLTPKDFPITATYSIGATQYAYTYTSSASNPYTFTFTPTATTNTNVTWVNLSNIRCSNNLQAVNTTSVLTILPSPTVTATQSNTVACAGAMTTLSATGAISYTWSTSQNTASISVNPTTTATYSVVGTNTVGCVSSPPISFTVNVNALPTMSVGAQTNVACFGGSTGAVTLTPTGGSGAGYSVTPTFTINLTAGSYTYTVKDGANCTSTVVPITITQPASALTAITSGTNNTNCITPNGQVSANPSGGTSGYNYVWSSGSSTLQALTGLNGGTYTVTVTDNNNCTYTTQATISNPAGPVISATSNTNNICSGNNITITPSGGATTYSIIPSIGTVTTGVTGATVITPTATISYSVVGTNATSCLSNTVALNVTVNATPTVAITASNNTICIGNSSALTLTGATTYTLLNTNASITSGASVSPTTTTTYSIQGSTGTCTSSATQQLITVNALPVVTATTSAAAICSGNTATLTAAGANTYTWSGGPTSATYTVTTTNNYVVTGTDANNCVNTATVNLTVNPTPTVAISASSGTICSGQTATLTAATANSYAWSTISTANTTTVMPTGTTVYTVTGTNTAGSCAATAQFTVSVNPKPDLALTNTTSIVCLGDANGTATVNATSGTSSYNYTWTGSASTTSVATALSAGPHTVQVNDSRGCKDTLIVNIAAPSASLATSVATATTGCSLSNGTATLTPNGGWNPGYSYVWQSNASTTTTATGYAAGTYTAQVTDANGCVKVQNFTISNPSTPTIAAVASNPTICSGLNTTITPSGAVSYSITGGAVSSSTVGTSFTVNPTANTTYSIIGTDASNCISTTATVAINVNATPTVAISATNNTICIGNSSALTLTGATTYTLLNNNNPITSGASVSPTTTTTYSIQGTTGTCTSSATQQVITVNALPVITATTSAAAICAGNTATLTAAGANTYTWTSGPTAATYTVNTANTYIVTGTDVNGCINTANVSLAVNALPIVTAVSNATAICVNQTATLTAGGAVTYTWTSPSSTNTVIAVSPTTTTNYVVIGTDGNNCVNTQTVTLAVNQLPIITASTITNVSCFGANNGSVIFTTAAGTPTYAIAGTNVSGTTASALAPTDYTYTVTDAAGCQNTTTLAITQPTAALLSSAAETATNTSCTSADGVATVTITGGTANYTINPLSGIVSGNTITGLGTGAHSYTVTDAKGCTAINSVTITGATGITSTLTAQSNVLCFGNNTASVTVSGLNEASGTYNYTLTNTTSSVNVASNTSGAFTNLPAGSYSVHIVGGVSNCISSQNITITEPTTALALTGITANSVVCNGGTAQVTATVTGGTTPYSYVWSAANTSTTSVATYTAGSYNVNINDANGCILATQNFTIHEAPVLTITSVATTTTGCGLSNGTATVNVSGGWNSSYTYSLNSLSQPTNTVNALTAGTYTVDVMDALGCITQTVFTISNPTTPTLNIASVTPAICAGQTATLTPTGAVSYTLASTSATFATNTTVTPTTTTVYNITGTDASNCTSAPLSVTVTVNELPKLSLVSSNAAICVGQTSTLTVNTTGTTTVDAYTWSTGVTTVNTTTVSPSAQTVYTVVGTNTVTGCVSSVQSVTIDVNQLPTITASTITNVSCYGLNNGSIDFTNTLGTPSYTVTGTNVSGTTATNLSPISYTYTVTDAAGCVNTTTVAITQPTAALLTTAAETSTNTSCTSPDGVATLTITGGTSGYTINTSSGVVSGNTITGLNTGAYTFTVTDANGCTAANSVTITGATGITSTLTAQSNVLCFGNNTASVTVNGLGEASGTYNYSLTPITGTTSATSNTTGNFTGLSAGTYSVLVTGGVSNCISSQNISITEPSLALALTGVTANSVICNGGTALASATVSGGTIPYTYVWSVNTSTLSSATYTAGNYSVDITDANGCALATQNFTINEAPVLTITSIATTTTGCGSASGTATINVNGGWNTSYTYSVNGTTVTNPLTNLAAATYTADVMDALGCTTQTVFTISNPFTPTLSIASIPAAICTGNSVTITPSGAVSYTITNPVQSFTTDVVLTPSTTTVYDITGTDASSCISAPLTVTINVNALPTINVVSTSSAICAGNTATLTANTTGTTIVNIYTWSTGLSSTNTETVSPTTPTIYSVIGTNTVSGCSSTAQSVTVNVNTTPTVAVASQTNVLCFGNNNGSVNMTTNATSPSYSPATTGLSAGAYTFTITDLASSCSNTVTATITGPTVALTASVANTTTNTSCATPNGAFTVTASGGTVDYNYTSASTTNTTGVFTGQGTGSQNITVADANGCTFTVSATILGVATPSISAATQTNVLCNGGNTGAASISVTGGTAPYNYNWSAGPNNLTAGSYTVTATDAGSCTVTQAFVITQPNAINAITSNVTTPCVGQPNGAITIEIMGGSPSYNVAWNPTGNTSTSGNSSSINNISEGQYVATITDANSCSYQYPVQLVAADGVGCTFVIPEIFSPNGDGKNDTWEIKGLENYPNNNVTVFNRWGDQVFKAEPYKNDWDGSNTGDKSILGKGALPVGTYYFILDLGNGDKPITGYVQLTK